MFKENFFFRAMSETVRRSRRLSFVFSLSSLVFFSACTDYVSQIEDCYGEKNDGLAQEPSSSSILQKLSSNAAKSSSSAVKASSSSSKKITLSSNAAKSSSSAVKASSSSSKNVTLSSNAARSSSSVVKSSSSKVTEPANVKYESITDRRDGQSYKTVDIGSQTWMAENLNYETANSYCYDDKVSDCTKYGRLYKWAAAMDSAGSWSTNGMGCGYNKTCSPTYPVRGVCPEGWHLPTKVEYETLFTAVGGFRNAGAKLKSMSGWNDNGNGVNAYSFSALPAGDRSGKGDYYGEGNNTFFWSSTEYNSGGAYSISMDLKLAPSLGYYLKYYGFSVRCVKDASQAIIKSSSSKQNQSSSSFKPTSSAVKSSSSKVINPAEVKTGSMKDSRDGQSYKTVTIGSQTWMAQNLNYETTNSYCYDNKATYCTKYGRLYTWVSAMHVCPEGWHLPTQEEWNTLLSAVGDSSIAGKKLKSTDGWNGSGNGTDDYSFSVLPAGMRNYDGNYYPAGAVFWSSTEVDSDLACNIFVEDYLNDEIELKGRGFSVRCVKDKLKRVVKD